MDVGKVVNRGKFVALNAHIRKDERSLINDLSFHLNKIEKKTQIHPKFSKKGNNNGYF